MQARIAKSCIAAAAAAVLGMYARAGAPIECAAGDDLQAALETARTRVDGGETDVTIQLGPGAYTITSELALDRAITLVGTQGPAATTISQATTAWSGSQRVLNITADGATVSGLTLSIPQFSISANGFPVLEGAVVKMTGESTVTNCFLVGPGSNKPIGTQNKFTLGGVSMTKGLVIDCTIRDIALSSGGGARLAGGTLANCVVTNCRAGNNNNTYTGGVGAGVRIENASAVVTNCLITGNLSTYFPGVGVYISNGTLVDSRIVGNAMMNTVNALQVSAEGIGVFQAGGTIRNCVIAENNSRTGECQDWFGQGGTITGTQMGLFAVGAGNVPRTPLFADKANGDWTILPSFTASAVDILPGTTVTFTAEDPAATGCSWDFGDGTTDTGATVTHTYSTKGEFDVELTYTKGGDTITRTRPAFIRVLGSEAYVRIDAGDGVFPYDTPETATSNAWKAIDTVRRAAHQGATGATVHVGAGEYGLVHEIVADIPIRILGEDPATTRLWGTNGMTRALLMSHADALVSGVSLRGRWSSSRTDGYGYGAGGRNGVGVNMSSGTLTNVVVENCIGGGQAWNAQGIGIYMTGGTLVDSIVRKCGNGDGGNGEGVFASGGLVERCEIVDNEGGEQHRGGDGVGIYVGGRAVVRDSLIARNCSHYRAGAGIYLNSGNALVENCTVVSNYNRSANGTVGAGVRQASGTLRNTIVWGNLFNGSADDITKSGGTAEYVCTSATLAGTGNIATDPKFADPEACDYRLSFVSPCIDQGVDTATVATRLDLDRAPRVADGDSDGTATVDIGCYEYTFSAQGLAATFTVENAVGIGSVTPTFTAMVLLDGVALSDVSDCVFTWDFGDGTTLSGTGAEFATVTHAYSGGQLSDVTLTVRRNEDVSEPYVREEGVQIYSDVAYVSSTGTATFPYDTPERATADLFEAYSELLTAAGAGASRCRLVIGDGEYSSTKMLECTFPCEITGNGPDRTTLRSAVNGDTFIKLAADGSILSGATLTGAVSGNSHGGAVSMVSRSMVTNCLFTGNTSSGHGQQGRGGAIYASAGVTVDCVITGNGDGDGGAGYNSTVYLQDTALIDRCIVTNNFGGGQYHTFGGAGITIGGGHVTNRNCLVAHNVNYYRQGAGILVTGGYPSIENCTVVDNEARQSGLVAGLVSPNGGVKVVNTILSGNLSGPVGSAVEANIVDPGTNPNYGGVTYCAAPELVSGEGNVAVSAEFRDRAANDYHLTAESSARLRGTVMDWMAQGLDLDGQPRLRGSRVDMGCYIGSQIGTFIMFR